MEVSQGSPIGFIGLGQMGLPIAQRLVGAGHVLLAYDLDASAVAPLQVAGNVSRSNSVLEIANQCEIVFTCLPSIESCARVSFGAGGLAEGARIRLLIHLSTTGSEAVCRIAEALRSKGISMLDAPVSGGPARARAGTMMTMASGPPQAFREAESLLRCYGNAALLSDQVGAAQTMKLINNMVSRVNLAIGCEAIVMAAKAGINPSSALAVLDQGTAQNEAITRKLPVMLQGGKLGAALRISEKDSRLWLDEANALELPSPLARSAFELFLRVLAECSPEDDVAAILERIDNWSGNPLRRVPGQDVDSPQLNLNLPENRRDPL